MDQSHPPIELDWPQILQCGYAFGIPAFFNGKFLPGISRNDMNSIKRGKIHRFPQNLRQKLSYLHERSICSSGIRVEFCSDAKSIQIASKLIKIKQRENYSNMAQACMDILVDGKFWMNYYPKWENINQIFLPQDGKLHRISFVFPNYAGFRLQKISLFNGSKITSRIPEFLLKNKPIVFYGSSITQGGCASRPALSYPYRLSETFCMNFINLAVSGYAMGELEMAEYVGSFKHASLFILDWGANLLDLKWGNTLEDRYDPFWRKIHSVNPEIPILFIGLQNFSHDLISSSSFRNHIHKKRLFIEKHALAACKEVNANKKKKLFDYIDGTSIINSNSLHLTLDGVHPNDLGHKTYADLLEWKIIDLLGNHIEN